MYSYTIKMPKHVVTGRDDFQILSLAGKGAFGKVREAKRSRERERERERESPPDVADTNDILSTMRQVWRVLHKPSGNIYAMKCMRKVDVLKHGFIDHANVECSIMADMSYHPFIVCTCNNDQQRLLLVTRCTSFSSIYLSIYLSLDLSISRSVEVLVPDRRWNLSRDGVRRWRLVVLARDLAASWTLR